MTDTKTSKELKDYIISKFDRASYSYQNKALKVELAGMTQYALRLEGLVRELNNGVIPKEVITGETHE